MATWTWSRRGTIPAPGIAALARDDGTIRAEYRAGHGPVDYLDACLERDAREASNALAAMAERMDRHVRSHSTRPAHPTFRRPADRPSRDVLEYLRTTTPPPLEVIAPLAA